MTQSKALPPHASFESIRKQAKKLARQFAAGDPDALARVHAQLPVPSLPLPLRDAQLIVAREYGFAGWQDLRIAVLRQEGQGLEWAVAEAERVIHANDIERLQQLIRDYPALLSWRGDSGESVLAFATESFGDSGAPDRERAFTRISCAEVLLDAGATVEPAIWEDAIRARAKGVLQLLSRRGVLPRNLETAAALGDSDAVRECLRGADSAAVTQAFFTACGFDHREVAAILLDRCIELDPALGERVDKWRGRSEFIAYTVEHPLRSASPWLTLVLNELHAAMRKGDLEEFDRWLEREPDAVEYGNAHLIPLLALIWPVPDDLPHAAGAGDFERVKSWFDEAGQPRLGSLGQPPLGNVKMAEFLAQAERARNAQSS